MTRLIFGILLLVAVPVVGHSQSSSTTIRHAVVSVAATNDEWTPANLKVNAGDMVIVRVPGTVTVGAYLGQHGADPVSPQDQTGYLEYKVGVSAGKPAGSFRVHVIQESGELKFRVRDTNHHDNSGQFEVDVIVLPPSAVPPAIRAN